jgi:pimeloyl-ACP methyl ester carboxylesterase
MLIPTRICSLALTSTAARIENTVGFFENLITRTKMFIPKSLDRSVSDAAVSLFPDSWLDAPDGTRLPQPGTALVDFPQPCGHYSLFDTNYERFAAQELNKRLDPGAMPKFSFMLQAIAAGWHFKSPQQLREIGDRVGRDRILVLHGTGDRMITVHHGRVLIEELKPGKSFVLDGSGHVLMLEKTEWFDAVVEELIQRTERTGGK